MLYAIVATDLPDKGSARAGARDTHLARLNSLTAAGRLGLAGPFPAVDHPESGPAGVTGSLIVAGFESLDAARQWADADPCVAAGVCGEVVVKPFRKVLP